MDYLLHHPDDKVNKAEFEKACGVGIIVTADEIEDAVRNLANYQFARFIFFF